MSVSHSEPNSGHKFVYTDTSFVGHLFQPPFIVFSVVSHLTFQEWRDGADFVDTVPNDRLSC